MSKQGGSGKPTKKPRHPVQPFSERLKQYARYVQETGEHWVPTRYVPPEGSGIGDNFWSWANQCRYLERRGRLPARQKKQLDELGFVWEDRRIADRRETADRRAKSSTEGEPESVGDEPVPCPCMEATMAKNGKRWLDHQHPVRPPSYPAQCDDLQRLLDEGLRFGCISADPPWTYTNTSTRGAAEDHYNTMTIEDLLKLPVESLAADDAFLFLWGTTNFLPESLDLVKAWGFTYKTQLIWTKPHMGLGNYVRTAHEYITIATRGKPKWKCRDIASHQMARRGRHSAKPEIFRNIMEHCADGPYLELFGRMQAPGWTVFGNQVERNLFSDMEGEDPPQNPDADEQTSEAPESGAGHKPVGKQGMQDLFMDMMRNLPRSA